MPVGKEEILDAIRCDAASSGGKPPGRMKFEQATGIREPDWLGRYWARWGDAVSEAGLQRNAMQEARPETDLLAALATLTRELGRFPTDAERRMRRRQDPEFTSWNSYRRFGRNADVAAALVAWCEEQVGCTTCVPSASPSLRPLATSPLRHRAPTPAASCISCAPVGTTRSVVSNSAGRRAYELAIQLPERLEVAHTIETDDPERIEAYWHRRFADRRANGEWFSLTKADVAAFRRRRRYM